MKGHKRVFFCIQTEDVAPIRETETSMQNVYVLEDFTGSKVFSRVAHPTGRNETHQSIISKCLSRF